MASSPRLAPHEMYSYSPPVSLWGLVESYVAPHEWPEVKHLLGESLVDQSLELQQEVQTLLEIWRDYRNETDNKPMYHRLPEPPELRDRLKKEISFFVENIREKSSSNGRNSEQILAKHSKDVLDYALSENKKPLSSGGSRPSTAMSSEDGRSTPMVIRTPDRLCQGSVVSDEVEAIQDKLTYLQLDGVVTHLRETIFQEIEWLKKDIDFLQGCLEEEADFRCTSSISREPTLSDLREERSRLEKEMLTSGPDLPQALLSNSTTVLKNPSFSTKASPSPPKTTSVKPSRPSPMKASHQIPTQVLSLQDTNKMSPSENAALKQRNRQTSQSPSTTRKALKDIVPSHVTIRLANGATSGGQITPSPPKAVKPMIGRPGSAQRFRKMVMQCRDDT